MVELENNTFKQDAALKYIKKYNCHCLPTRHLGYKYDTLTHR